MGHLSARDSMKGTLRKAPLLGKWASASIGTPLLGNMERRFFLRAFLSGGSFKRFSRDMHMYCKRVSLSIGEPEGGSFAGTF